MDAIAGEVTVDRAAAEVTAADASSAPVTVERRNPYTGMDAAVVVALNAAPVADAVAATEPTALPDPAAAPDPDPLPADELSDAVDAPAAPDAAPDPLVNAT